MLATPFQEQLLYAGYTVPRTSTLCCLHYSKNNYFMLVTLFQEQLLYAVYTILRIITLCWLHCSKNIDNFMLAKQL